MTDSFTTDSRSLENTRNTSALSLFMNLAALSFVHLLGVPWHHPIIWVHIFVMSANGVFMIFLWGDDEWIPIADQGLLSLGRKTMESSTFLLVFLLGFLLPDFTPWESVRTPAETNFVRTIPRGVVWLYLLTLGGAVASVGLITSGLYDAQGAETAGNAGATKK